MKILVILSRFPYPLEKGDKLRAFNQIKYLSTKHEIHLFALTDSIVIAEHKKAVEPWCKSITIQKLTKLSIAWNIFLALFKSIPFQAGYFYNSKAQRKINQLIEHIQPDHIYCQFLRVASYVKDARIPKTLDYQDVLSKGMQRRFYASPFYLKPLLWLEYKRLVAYERRIFSWFDNKTIISKPDRDFIPHPDKDKIVIVINGVDTDYFRPMPAEKQYDLVFTGNMGYPPNVNAGHFLVNEVLPLVHKNRPETKVVLAGATPNPGIVALESDKVHITGWVEDIRSCYAKAKIFIAPMRIGTGLQNKLLEAMAMKIPCITTSLANSALEAKPGEEILVGDNAGELAEHIMHLLENKEFSNHIAEAGYRFVNSKYNWASATAILEQLIANSSEKK